MDKIASDIIGACWIVFLGYWMASAVRVKRTAERQSPASAAAYRVPLLLGWFVMVFRGFPGPLNWRIIPGTDAAAAAGAAICVTGLLITLWARRTLAGNWSANVTFKQGHELVRNGPYRFVRHPIYTGLLVMCLGVAMAAGRVHVWLGIVLLAVGFWVKIKQEERLMLRHFPNDYPVYQKEVKALIPAII